MDEWRSRQERQLEHEKNEAKRIEMRKKALKISVIDGDKA